MSISASMVKELRERTGAGMMECKKALVETDGTAIRMKPSSCCANQGRLKPTRRQVV